MDIIHLLPDSVANQIAAGEVVQRPASVIKELLENSVDAGATEIHVVLREAGKELIQVIDNGKGMSPTDARMAFERHATSKITEAADLFALHTMGFRGEALASIVAVAEVDLRTRRHEDETGVWLKLAGCRLERQEVVACPAGTNLEVRNLFYNVPARRKFLKSNQTELSNIITEIQHVALANPGVSFTLVHNDVQMFQLTSGSFRQRIQQLFGKTVSQQMLPLEVENDLVRITGFVGQPEGARKKGALQYFFVNDRYMRHPYFHKAVMECYSELIPSDAQPNYFICLTVDPATIDVNIHPTKTEIKFENEAARWHILMAGVREALGKYNAVPTIDFDQADAPEISLADWGEKMPKAPRTDVNPNYNPFRKAPVLQNWQSVYEDFEQSREMPASQSPSSAESRGTESSPFAGEFLSSRLDSVPVAGDAAADTLPSRMATALDEVPDYQDPAFHLDLQEAGRKQTFRKYLQIAGKYIAASTKQGLVLIEQHRAHTAILFDRYYQQVQQRQGITQRELFPEMIEVAQKDVPIVEQILPELGWLGFELDHLGGGSFALNGKPASLDHNIDFNALLLQMIEAARDEVHGIGDDLAKRLSLRLASAQAIPVGKTLSEEEMSQLVETLYDLPDHTLGPDGNPIAVRFGLDEIAARF